MSERQVDNPKPGAEYDPIKDIENSFLDAYRAIRDRMAAGGKPWPKVQQ